MLTCWPIGVEPLLAKLFGCLWLTLLPGLTGVVALSFSKSAEVRFPDDSLGLVFSYLLGYDTLRSTLVDISHPFPIPVLALLVTVFS